MSGESLSPPRSGAASVPFCICARARFVHRLAVAGLAAAPAVYCYLVRVSPQRPPSGAHFGRKFGPTSVSTICWWTCFAAPFFCTLSGPLFGPEIDPAVGGAALNSVVQCMSLGAALATHPFPDSLRCSCCLLGLRAAMPRVLGFGVSAFFSASLAKRHAHSVGEFNYGSRHTRGAAHARCRSLRHRHVRRSERVCRRSCAGNCQSVMCFCTVLLKVRVEFALRWWILACVARPCA